MGPIELLILLFVVFLILGPKRITAVFRSLGRGVRDFTNELGGNKKDADDKKELSRESSDDREKD